MSKRLTAPSREIFLQSSWIMLIGRTIDGFFLYCAARSVSINRNNDDTVDIFPNSLLATEAVSARAIVATVKLRKRDGTWQVALCWFMFGNF